MPTVVVTEPVVARIQRRWREEKLHGDALPATPGELATLRARLNRIHRLGPRFQHIRLSTHVADRSAAATFVAPGGLVATDG